MKKNKDLVRVWVDKSFARKLKKEAIENDMQYCKYTKKLAEQDQRLSELMQKKKKKQGGFKIGL